MVCLLPSMLLPPSGLLSVTLARDAAVSGPQNITITVKVDLDGGSDKLAERWKSAFETYWNRAPGGGPFRWCGREVTFVGDVALKKGAPRPGADQVEVKHRLFGRYYRSESDIPQDPTATDATGTWWSNADDATIAHEFGHLIGLDDEYVDVTDARGKVIGAITKPEFQGDFSIMAHHLRGRVLLRHVDAVMRKHHRVAPDCVWVREKREVRRLNSPAIGGTESWFYVVEATLFDDGKGSLTGDGTYIATGAKRHENNTVGVPVVGPTQIGMPALLYVPRGAHPSSHVRVLVEGHAKMTGQFRYESCPGSRIESIDYSIKYPVEGDLRDGKFQQASSSGPSSEQTNYSIEIEERGR